MATKTSNITYGSLVVTPAIAAELLLKASAKVNRGIKPIRVKLYAAEMRSGRWHRNGETIKFDRDGVLRDGQHRLRAVIESGCTIVFDTASDVSEEAFLTIDQAKARGGNDALAFAGHKNVNALASAARWVNHIKIRDFTIRPSNDEIVKIVNENPGLLAWVERFQKSNKARSLMPSAFVACFYLSSLKNGDDLLLALFNEVVDGDHLSKGDPAYELRERLIANKSSIAKLQATTLVAFCIKTINAAVLGRRVGVLRLTHDETFPQII